MTTYATALGLTVVIECAVVLLWIRPRSLIELGLLVMLVVGLNLVTHPLAWMAFSSLPGPAALVLTGTEAAVIVLETVVLTGVPGVTVCRAASIAATMNVASALVGLLFV